MVPYIFTNGTVANADEVNANFKHVDGAANTSVRVVAKNSYLFLKNNSSYENDELITVDLFSTENGINNTVDTNDTTAIFDVDHYRNSTLNTDEYLYLNIVNKNSDKLILYVDYSFGNGDSLQASVSDVTNSTDYIDLTNQMYNEIDISSLDTTQNLKLIFKLNIQNYINDTWTTKASMSTARSSLTSSAVNNKIYCIGGYDGNSTLSTNEEYDPSTDTWTTKASMPTARTALTSSVVDDKIYVIGGSNGNALSTNEEYDPATNSWTTKANMPTARYYLTSSAAYDKIYAIGGYYGSNVNEEYDPFTNTWTTKADMPTERYYLNSATVNNKIYVLGGSSTTTNEEYDPYTNTWSTKADIPIGSENFGCSVVKSKIYIFGGSISNNTVNEEYNPATNSWTTRTDMPTGRSNLTASVVNNKIYCIGGKNSSNLSTNEEYIPPDVTLKLKGYSIINS